MSKKQIRTKVVEMDGASYTIAPLTLEQIDEYVAPLEDVANQNSIGFKKGFQVVCYALNNALPEGTPDEERWTDDRVRKEIDLVLFEKLQGEIISFSGFKIDNKPVPGQVGVPGEFSAASEKGKSQLVEAESSQVNMSATSAVV